MKTRFWIALLLAATLTVPALAQQTSPTQNQPPAQQDEPAQPQAQPQQAQPQTETQAQPQTQTPTSDQKAADQSASQRQPLTLEKHEGFWGKINPFARKKYVARQLEPVKDRVNELDQLTAANSKMIKDVDARAQQGIQMASNKASEADTHAIEAGNRAQQAQQTATQASTRIQAVEQVVTNLDQYKPVTQTEIRFRPGQTVLSRKAKEALDDMSRNLKDQRGYIIEVQGFSAGRGEAAIESSQRMADAVRRYLVIQQEIPVYRVHVLGLGSVRPQSASAEGGKPQRMRGAAVEVSLLKNDLEQLSAPGTTGSATSQGGISGAATTAPAMTPTAQPGASQPASNMNNPASPSMTSPSAASPVPPKQQQPAPREQQQQAIPPKQ
jgi:outer membrane protein OmpA-like peptidoglycan-associated protein